MATSTVIEIRACRVLVVAYDTSFCPSGRIAWVGEDTRGSLPLDFSGMELVGQTGVILHNNGAARPFKIEITNMDREKVRRMVDIVKYYLNHDNVDLAPSSFRMEWRFGNGDEF